jgi:hypothetical protein
MVEFGMEETMIDPKMLLELEQYISEKYGELKSATDKGIKYSYNAREDGAWAIFRRLTRRILSVDLPDFEDSFAKRLLKLIHASGKSEAEIYKRAGVDRRLFAKIRNDPAYHPGKSTVIALTMALELDSETARDLLARAGYSLSVALKEDIVVAYFLEQGIHDLFLLDETLDHFGLPLVRKK